MASAGGHWAKGSSRAGGLFVSRGAAGSADAREAEARMAERSRALADPRTSASERRMIRNEIAFDRKSLQQAATERAGRDRTPRQQSLFRVVPRPAEQRVSVRQPEPFRPAQGPGAQAIARARGLNAISRGRRGLRR